MPNPRVRRLRKKVNNLQDQIAGLQNPAPTDPNAPFDPLAQTYQTVGDFNHAIRARARQQYRPLLQTISSNERDQERRHLGRQNDIEKYYGYMGQGLQKAYQDADAAMNKLIASSQGQDSAAQAALNQSLTSQSAPGLAATAQVGTDANQFSLMGALGAGLEQAAKDQALGGIGMNEANRGEENRFSGIESELDRQRADVRRTIPDLRRQARADIMGEERTAATQRLQDELARKEFRLKKKTTNAQTKLAGDAQGLEEDKFQHQKHQDQLSYQITTKQLDQEQQKINIQKAAAKTAKEKAALELKGKVYANGVEAYNQYNTPTKLNGGVNADGKVVKGWETSTSPVQMFRILTGQIKMSPRQAYKLMISGPNDRMSKWATAALQLSKTIDPVDTEQPYDPTIPDAGDTGPGGGLIGLVTPDDPTSLSPTATTNPPGKKKPKRKKNKGLPPVGTPNLGSTL